MDSCNPLVTTQSEYTRSLPHHPRPDSSSFLLCLPSSLLSLLFLSFPLPPSLPYLPSSHHVWLVFTGSLYVVPYGLGFPILLPQYSQCYNDNYSCVRLDSATLPFKSTVKGGEDGLTYRSLPWMDQGEGGPSRFCTEGISGATMCTELINDRVQL